MVRHIFDLNETASRMQAAAQLRSLADQIAAGSVELAHEDLQAPTEVVEPVDVVVDLARHRHHVELTLQIRWPTDAAA